MRTNGLVLAIGQGSACENQEGATGRTLPGAAQKRHDSFLALVTYGFFVPSSVELLRFSRIDSTRRRTCLPSARKGTPSVLACSPDPRLAGCSRHAQPVAQGHRSRRTGAPHHREDAHHGASRVRACRGRAGPPARLRPPEAERQPHGQRVRGQPQHAGHGHRLGDDAPARAGRDARRDGGHAGTGGGHDPGKRHRVPAARLRKHLGGLRAPGRGRSGAVSGNAGPLGTGTDRVGVQDQRGGRAGRHLHRPVRGPRPGRGARRRRSISHGEL